jgi:hypothetical protein
MRRGRRGILGGAGHLTSEPLYHVIVGSGSGSQDPLPIADEALEFGLAAIDDARTRVKRQLEHLVKAFNIARAAPA